MIVREWRALATRDNAQAYIKFFGQTVVPILKTVAGNRGARLMHREVEDGVELVAMTFWESRDAIQAFSGTTRQSPEATTKQILAGLDWAVRKGARVINMSFAGPYDPMLALAMKNAHAKGVVLIAASGNLGPK